MNGRRPAAKGDVYISDKLLTIPNILCLIRLAGALVLVPVAWRGESELFLWLFLFFAATDWLDGKLAILLNQRSIFGARLDSWADAALYAALIFGALTMHGQALQGESLWVAAALGTYLVSTLAGFYKFKLWPSYHTRAAKTSWLLTAIAVVFLFREWELWPLRLAALAVTLTNIEAFLITLISPQWRSDVTSIYHVLRDN